MQKRRISSVPLTRILLYGICLIVVLYLVQTVFNLSQTEQPSRIPVEQRADALRDAIRSWTQPKMPVQIAQIASQCVPIDAAQALIPNDAAAVIDVGANKGYPVTKVALMKTARIVISVEPDDRNYKVLKNSRNINSTFHPVKGAAGREPGQATMLFHKERDDFTCFNCLDRKKSSVFTQNVQIYTVDELVSSKLAKDEHVALFKTDTQGFEADVLAGARMLLPSQRLRAVLVEFDPKLLRTKERALDVLDRLLSSDLQCVHLAFAGLSKNPHAPKPYYSSQPIDKKHANRFYEFVKHTGGYTDLMCLRQPLTTT